MEFVLLLLFWTACVFGLIIVHESGHYFAGLAAGIPATEMRIRLFAFPQHIALRHGERWVSPSEYESYVETCWHHLKTIPRVYLYVAGGYFVETIFTAIAAVVLVQLGQAKFAFMIVLLSTVMAVPWIILEPIMTWRTGHAWGDLSALWQLARLPTILFVTGLVAARGVLLWYAAA